jgi:hypothetical protein
MVKVKQKRSNIAMDNRDVAAPALSPLGKIRFSSI